MKIKIDCEILREQIDLCDACVDKFGVNSEVGEMFDGISNLLSEICYAVEENKNIEFEKGE